MFNKEVYTNRRKKLRDSLEGGIALFLGNQESAMNYADNGYHFRQDSNFSYFFGIEIANMAGIVDLDTDQDILFGDDVSVDDIIWMGPQPTMKELGAKAGIANTASMSKLPETLKEALSKGRNIHVLPFYRGDTIIQFADLLGISHSETKQYVSEKLIKAVVSIRSNKEPQEIEELEKAAAVGYKMHTTAMKMCRPGIYEMEIAGAVEGVALSGGGMLSFPIILTQNGETLHNHYHGNKLESGKLMLVDTGAETPLHYASDFTRTMPVNGKFSEKQKNIYNIVLEANNHATSLIKPGIPYRDVHLAAVLVIAKGLTNLGIMKGNPEDAVQEGAHAMFMPHGLGHMMGLDVHDMEGLGEDYVGYDDEIKRSTQFGLKGLRLGRKLQPNFVLTNEPGIYFIPALIKKFQSEKKFMDFINYEKLEKEYFGFGGIRLEDDILVTENGCRLIGKRIPITVEEVENTMNS